MPAWWADLEPQSLSISEGIQRQVVLDINSAPLYQWCLLEGIGEGRATRIVRERERLGEFKSFTQLEDVPGLPINCLKKAKHILFLGNQSYESYLGSQADPTVLSKNTVSSKTSVEAQAAEAITTAGGTK